MSKPYTFGESTYLTLQPLNDQHYEQEESGFETMNDFNNSGPKGVRYSTLDYSSVLPFSFSLSLFFISHKFKSIQFILLPPSNTAQ